MLTKNKAVDISKRYRTHSLVEGGLITLHMSAYLSAFFNSQGSEAEALSLIKMSKVDLARMRKESQDFKTLEKEVKMELKELAKEGIVKATREYNIKAGETNPAVMAKKKKDDDLKKAESKTKRKLVDRLETIAEGYSDFGLYKDEGLINKEMCAYLAVYESNMAHSSNACSIIGIKTTSTINNWKKSNAWFKEACNTIADAQIDIVENKLKENIMKGDVASIIFFLKTKGKDRGYREKDKVVDNSIEVVNFNFIEVDRGKVIAERIAPVDDRNIIDVKLEED